MLNSRDCASGKEQSERFRATNGKYYVQYDYRDENGNLFSTVAPDINTCRKRRDDWLKAVSAGLPERNDRWLERD